MRIFFIVLAVILAVLLALVLLLLFLFLIGKARIRIIYRNKLKVILTVLGIRFRILPRKKDKPDSPAAKRRAEKRARKKKRKKSNVPEGVKPELPDLLDMIFSLLRVAYEKSRGKVSIRMHCFKLRVATDDAAKTAIIYGTTVGIVSTMMQWIQKKFNRIDRKPGDMQVYPDYLATKPDIQIDLELGMHFRHALPAALEMLGMYQGKKERALQKAYLHKKEKEARKASKKTSV